MPYFRLRSDGSLVRLHLAMVQADGSLVPPVPSSEPQVGRVHELGALALPFAATPQVGRVHELGVFAEAYTAPPVPQLGRVHELGVFAEAYTAPDPDPDPDPQLGRVHEVSLEAFPA